MQYHKSAQELYNELCHHMVTFSAQDEGTEGASTHVLNALGACVMHMSSISVQAFMSDHATIMLYHFLPAAVAMLGSCTELIKAAPAYGHVNIILPGEFDMPTCAVLNRHLMLCCVMLCCVVLRLVVLRCYVFSGVMVSCAQLDLHICTQ